MMTRAWQAKTDGEVGSLNAMRTRRYWSVCSRRSPELGPMHPRSGLIRLLPARSYVFSEVSRNEDNLYGWEQRCYQAQWVCDQIGALGCSDGVYFGDSKIELLAFSVRFAGEMVKSQRARPKMKRTVSECI
ncbi:hypothetical protein QQ045_018032 [Rhodiola kirilowii]